LNLNPKFLLIGERRLEASACISSILKENPNAEWVLKGQLKRI